MHALDRGAYRHGLGYRKTPGNRRMTAYVPLNAFLPYLAAGWTFASRGGLPVADAMVGHHGRYRCLMVRA